jgi:hypothetical protein
VIGRTNIKTHNDIYETSSCVLPPADGSEKRKGVVFQRGLWSVQSASCEILHGLGITAVINAVMNVPVPYNAANFVAN